MAIGLQPDPRILLGIGAGMQKKLHGGQARFGPIWRVHWQIQDRVDLLVENFTGRIRVDLDRQFQLQLIARYEERKYRLRERGGDQASRLKDRRVPVRLRLVWRKSDRTRIDFDIGANFEQRLSTNAGDSNQSIEQGTTIFFGVGVRFRN